MLAIKTLLSIPVETNARHTVRPGMCGVLECEEGSKIVPDIMEKVRTPGVCMILFVRLTEVVLHLSGEGERCHELREQNAICS